MRNDRSPFLIWTGFQKFRVLFHVDDPVVSPIDVTTTRDPLHRIFRQPVMIDLSLENHFCHFHEP